MMLSYQFIGEDFTCIITALTVTWGDAKLPDGIKTSHSDASAQQYRCDKVCQDDHGSLSIKYRILDIHQPGIFASLMLCILLIPTVST